MTERPYLHRSPPDATPPRTPGPGPAPVTAAPQPVPPSPAEEEARPAPASAPPPARQTPVPASPTKALNGPDLPPLGPWQWLGLAAIVVLALALRLRDPLSSAVIGAEDPYLHMERTWDLLQDKTVSDYPPGFMVLLLPLAMMGPDAFAWAARFLPPLFGAGMVAGTFFVCRRSGHGSGAFVASLLVALMPEAIRRTNLLFPTALDLALLPLLLLLVLRASEGQARAWVGIAVLGVLFLMVHPWVLALAIPPLLLFWLVLLLRGHAKWRVPAGGGLVVGAAAFVLLLQQGVLEFLGLHHAGLRLAELVARPSSIVPFPQFVDLPAMLTVPALFLAAMGAILAFMRPTRFGVLALCWTTALLPLVAVDWFDVWYLPHRAVAYLAIGVAMLAALPVSLTIRLLAEARPTSRVPATLGALALVLALAIPTTATMDGWYRLYDEEDQEAWAELSSRGTDHVVTGSWQARTGYRAMTGGDAEFNPEFFNNSVVREFELHENPGLVVLVDRYAVDNQVQTEFLNDWERIGTWGDTSAYTRP